MKKNKNLNVPNILSIFRLCMVPVFAVVYFAVPAENSHYGALIVYIIAQGTDVVDGYIARKYNQITKLGRVLDPLADKLMSFTVVICLTVTYNYLWWVAAVLLVKELMMGIGAVVLYKRITDVPSANVIGKASTTLFYIIFIVAMLFPNLPQPLLTGIFAVGVGLTVVALISYARNFIRNLRRQPVGKDE